MFFFLKKIFSSFNFVAVFPHYVVEAYSELLSNISDGDGLVGFTHLMPVLRRVSMFFCIPQNQFVFFTCCGTLESREHEHCFEIFYKWTAQRLDSFYLLHYPAQRLKSFYVLHYPDDGVNSTD